MNHIRPLTDTRPAIHKGQQRRRIVRQRRKDIPTPRRTSWVAGVVGVCERACGGGVAVGGGADGLVGGGGGDVCVCVCEGGGRSGGGGRRAGEGEEEGEVIVDDATAEFLGVCVCVCVCVCMGKLMK